MTIAAKPEAHIAFADKIAGQLLSKLYQSMFRAKQTGDDRCAELLMLEIENLRIQIRQDVDVQSVERIKTKLPHFVRSVLDKSQVEIGKTERSNCINAAFNFHDLETRWATYSTMDFLSRIKSDFIQIDSSSAFEFGDLIVLWSRVGGSWDNQIIRVEDMDPGNSDFPYGLVFDHVAVRIDRNLVFHKPDPTRESRYQIDRLESVSSVTAAQKGFEITYHRKKSGALR